MSDAVNTLALARSPGSPSQGVKTELIRNLHLKALDIVRRYKCCEVELIDILEKADTHKVHYILGYSSLFKYATDGLGLSSEVAYIYINVARKAKEVPALKVEIQKGAISLSKAKKITSVLNKSNQDYWLNLAKTSSKRELEKQVAAISPRELIPEKMQYVSQNLETSEKVKILSLPTLSAEATRGAPSQCQPVRVHLQVGISEKLMLKLRRAQDVLSQKRREGVSLEDVLDSMTELFLERNDPVKKAERLKMRGKLQDLETSQGIKVSADESSKATGDLQGLAASNEQVPGLVTSGGAASSAEDQRFPESCTQASREDQMKHKAKDITGASGSRHSRSIIKVAMTAPPNSAPSAGSSPDAGGLAGGPGRASSGAGLSTKQSVTYERKPLHSALKHAVYMKHQGQCSHIDPNGTRCSVRRHLEIHHKVPVAAGGTNELSNLTLYCYGHHRGEHLRREQPFSVST